MATLTIRDRVLGDFVRRLIVIGLKNAEESGNSAMEPFKLY